MSESLAWDEEGLQQRCTDLRETLLQSNMSTLAEVEMYWPGGAQNREEPPGDWIYCYAQLCGMLRREETPAQMQERQQAEAAVLAALREEPECVELIARDAEGGPVHLHVYPKSFDTLCHVMARDLELLKLAAVLSLLHEAGVGLVTERGRAIYEEISYQNRVLTWIVTSEGVNLPYPADNPRPDIPDWTQALDAADVVRVLRAHQRVNGQRIALIGDLLGASSKGGKKSRGPGWATLAALAATELGTSSRSLLRDWSLAGWLAQMLLAQDAKAEALAEAKAEHSHGR